MTICKNCKHYNQEAGIYTYDNGSGVKKYFHLEAPKYFVIEYESMKMCTLNKITGKDDARDTSFSGNIHFNCGGFENV